MFPEDEIVLISAIEHFSYCPRQCGLIHLEQVYEENVFTLRGRQAHQRVHEPSTTWQGETRLERALPVWSDEMGLYGVADNVEFHADGSVVPLEYKHGPRRDSLHDDLQLCAYALCLEEMLNVPVVRGAVYSAKSRRRRDVPFDEPLRSATRQIIDDIRSMTRSLRLPEPVDDGRCKNCSLVDACIPSTLTSVRRAVLQRTANDLFVCTADE